MGLVKDTGNTVTSPSNTVSIKNEPTHSNDSWANAQDVIEDQRDTKTKQIQAQGVIQAAVQAPVLQMWCTDYEQWWAKVEETAKRELEFIWKNSK